MIYKNVKRVHHPVNSELVSIKTATCYEKNQSLAATLYTLGRYEIDTYVCVNIRPRVTYLTI